MVLAKKADKWRGFNKQAISEWWPKYVSHLLVFILIKLQNFITNWIHSNIFGGGIISEGGVDRVIIRCIIMLTGRSTYTWEGGCLQVGEHVSGSLQYYSIILQTYLVLMLCFLVIHLELNLICCCCKKGKKSTY